MAKKRLERPLGKQTQKIVAYFFEHPESTNKLLCQQFGLSSGRISQILSNERVLNLYPILARRKLKSMVPKALSRFDALLTQKQNLEVARKVSESILNSEKVLEPAPLVNINVLASLENSELENKINLSRALPSRSIDGELV